MLLFPHIEGDGRTDCWCAPKWEDEPFTTTVPVTPRVAIITWGITRTVHHIQPYWHRKRHGATRKLFPIYAIPDKTVAGG